MVKTAEARTLKSINKNSGEVVTLRLKALLRAYLLNPSKPFTVNTLKDEHAKALIDAYNLDLRTKQNAWECWRELYYSFFKTHQEVLTVEQASTPYTEQIFSLQPYEGV